MLLTLVRAQDAILAELDESVGFVECNKKLSGLLKQAMLTECRQLLGRMRPEIRKASLGVLNNVCVLQTKMGSPDDLAYAEMMLGELISTKREDFTRVSARAQNRQYSPGEDDTPLPQAVQLMSSVVRAETRTALRACYCGGNAE